MKIKPTLYSLEMKLLKFEYTPLTGKKSNSKKSMVGKNHMLLCDHIASTDDFKPVTQISMLRSKKVF